MAPVADAAVHPATPPRRPAGHAPRRHPRSVRRTSSIDMTWPDGRLGQLRLDGSARDILTSSPDEAPTVLDRASASVGVSPERVIEDITVDPSRPGVDALVGARCGSSFRTVLDEVLPGERATGTPLHLLLDDVAGSSLIAGFAWSRWTDEWRRRPPGQEVAPARNLEGVCIGFRPGSSALTLQAVGTGGHNVAPVPPLPHPDDPAGWHELAELPPVSMRRARRIDAWIDGDVIVIDSGFQDSAGEPGGGRVAVHEYRLGATADATTGRLLSVDADPRVLPYAECPSAANNVDRMLDVELVDLRAVVLERLARTAGCTHLNDALRALAEVPALLAQIPR